MGGQDCRSATESRPATASGASPNWRVPLGNGLHRRRQRRVRDIPLYKAWCIEWGTDTTQHEYAALDVKSAAALHARYLGRAVPKQLWPEHLRVYVIDPRRNTTLIVDVHKTTTIDFTATDEYKAR